MTVLPPLPVVVPLLVASAIAATASRLPRRLGEAAAIATAGACLLWSFMLLARVSDVPSIYWFAGWHPTDGIALGISFTIDTAGAALAALASTLMLGALVYAIHYFEETLEHRFHILMLVFLGALNGFFLTGDLFNVFVFFELMGVAAYSLTGYKIEQPAPLQGALGFAITNSLGAFTLLIGIGLVYARTGALNLAQAGEALSARAPDGLVIAALALILVGLFVKAAIVPFHFWLADAHAVAPTPVCVIFSGVMVEAGLYAAIRIYWITFGGAVGGHSVDVGRVFIGAGIVTMVVAAVMCFMQQHLKRLLAYSTIAHMGTFLIGVGTVEHVGLAGTGLYVLSHALAKGALFMGAGIVLLRLGSVDDEALLGRGRELRGTALLFLVGGLAVAGLPPFGTFLGKSLIEDAVVAQNMQWIPWLIAAASALTGAAILRAAGRIFLGWGPRDVDRFGADVFGEKGDERESAQSPDHTPWTMALPAAAMLIGSLGLGLVPHLSARAEMAADRFLDRTSYVADVLFDEEHPATKPETTTPGTSAFVFGVGSAIGAVALAWIALFRRKLPARLRLRTGAILRPPIDALRAIHSGDVRDYAAWLTTGLAALAGLLALAIR